MNHRSPSLEEKRQQGDTAFPCAMYRADSDCEVQGAPFLTKPHWHTSIEILHFEKGHFQFMVNMDRYEINEACYALVDSGMIHSISAEPPYLESALLFSPELLRTGGFDQAEQQILSPLSSGKLSLPRIIKSDHPVYDEFDRIYNMIQRTFMETDEMHHDQYVLPTSSPQLRVKAGIMLLICSLTEAGLLESAPSAPDAKAEGLKEVLTYIADHYREKIFLKQLADLMNLNEQYFSRFFKKAVGKSPFEYINEIRIKQAAKLLIETNQSVLEISLASGFGNMGHFINVFKRTTGMKPLEFRAKQNNAPITALQEDDKPYRKDELHEKTMVE